MQRRKFVQIALLASMAGVLFAQGNATPDRLSGSIKSINKEKMSIEIAMRKSPNVVRVCFYDANTRFTYKNKPAKADDLKEGLRIVAVGRFEGVNLKASDIALNER